MILGSQWVELKTFEMTLFLNYLPLRKRDKTIFEKENLKIRFSIFVRSDIPLALFCRFYPATFSVTSAPIPNALIPANETVGEENNEVLIFNRFLACQIFVSLEVAYL